MTHMNPFLELLRLHAGTEIADKDGWQLKRKDIQERFLGVLGEGPPKAYRLTSRILSEAKADDHTRYKVVYSSREGDDLPAYLLVPSAVVSDSAGEKHPAVLCLHGTYEEGKEGQAGLVENSNNAQAVELVKRGFVALAPDHLCAGERRREGYGSYDTAPFYREYPEWSAVGKSIHDAMRAVDYLESLPFVDGRRIGCIGHSLGGHSSVFAAAFDERIVACVSNCGVTVLWNNPTRVNWARTSWYVYLPRLRPFFEQGGNAPFEFHEIMALIAPRAFLNISAMEDVGFGPIDAMYEFTRQIQRVYRLLEAGDRFGAYLHGGGHGFAIDSKALAYAWLDRWLRAE